MNQPDFSKDSTHVEMLDSLIASKKAPSNSGEDSPGSQLVTPQPTLGAGGSLNPRKQIGAGLLETASTIWSSADVLRGAGIRGSDYPKMMMPFFALMLLESRLIRQRREMIEQFESSYGRKFDIDPNGPDIQDDLLPAMKGANLGFHQSVAETGLGLGNLAQVQGGNFLNRFKTWMEGWDTDTQQLLGFGYAQGQLKFLDIQGIASDLQAKDVLWAFSEKWGSIDLTAHDNSEVTTIEEHIKRKWADISAETAGEQYTPSDLGELGVGIQVAMLSRGLPADGIVRVYDPACGGGNFVFAAEDALRAKFPTLSVVSRGQELNDSLFAFAAIESRFRPNSHFEYGNTLTNDGFPGEKFDAIMANPPYGVDWSAYAKAILADASGRFSPNRMPPTSDGQLLFLQHIVHHLSDHGVATVVHSGSTLFSGDAGGGESETRRHLLQELDVVEAIIQLPKNMFFNTGINTYLWVINRNKPAKTKGKVILIDASACSSKLKKNLNQKNCEIDELNRQQIIATLMDFENTPNAKVVSVDDLLYNKVEISITRKDANGNGVTPSPQFELKNSTLIAGSKIFTFDSEGVFIMAPAIAAATVEGRESASPSPKETEATIKAVLKEADGALTLILGTNDGWRQDPETREVFQKTIGGEISLGLGAITIKTKITKAKGIEKLKLLASIDPLIEKDIETIPYSSEVNFNESNIHDFLGKWISEPVEISSAKIGCEINFNRMFPKTVNPRSVSEILKDLDEVDHELARTKFPPEQE